MAVTNDWGQAAKNSTNGFGKLATNTINEGAIYENSWSGDTALIGTSAAFAYGKSSYNQGEADPTPTITGTAGGTFSSDGGVSFVSTSTGEIDLSASTIASHTIFYIVDGVQAGQTIDIVAAPYSSTSSFTFDGVNDYFDAGIMPTLNNVTQFTISGWYRFDNTSRLEAIVSNGGDVNNYNFLLQHWPSSNVSVFIASSLGDGGSNYVKTSNNFITSTTDFYHIVVVYDGSLSTNILKAKIYVNGIDVTVNGSGTIPVSTTNTTGALNIAQWENIGRYFDGNIDEVSIWDTALSSDAITEIYNSGAPSELTSLTNASSSNLKAWYKMGE